MRRRLANAYLSAVISISLVLLLVGVASMLLVNAKSVSDYFKEHMQISVLLKQEVEDDEALAFQAELDSLEFIHSTRFVSREEGTEEMKEMLGEDFLSVFETSPVPSSLELTLEAQYVEADSLDKVKARLLESPLVDEVDYQQSLVESLNENIGKISLLLGPLSFYGAGGVPGPFRGVPGHPAVAAGAVLRAQELRPAVQHLPAQAVAAGNWNSDSFRRCDMRGEHLFCSEQACIPQEGRTLLLVLWPITEKWL